MNRIGALCGAIAVAGNVLGVVVLGDIPSAYRPGTVPIWAEEVLAAPAAAATSAVAFTIGLLALAGWALALGFRLRQPVATAGAAVIAAGALLNAAGTPAPLVVGELLAPACTATVDCIPAASALLGASLALDALFNLLLGLGLISLAVALARHDVARWLVALTTAAGLASLPVGLQVFSTTAADLLALAAPLWLAVILATSAWLWRQAS